MERIKKIVSWLLEFLVSLNKFEQLFGGGNKVKKNVEKKSVTESENIKYKIKKITK